MIFFWFKLNFYEIKRNCVKSWFQLQIYWPRWSDLAVRPQLCHFHLLIYLLRQVRRKSSWNSRRKRMMQVRDLFSLSFITSFLIFSNEWNVRNEASPLIRCGSFTFTRANIVDCNYSGWWIDISSKLQLSTVDNRISEGNCSTSLN